MLHDTKTVKEAVIQPDHEYELTTKAQTPPNDFEDDLDSHSASVAVERENSPMDIATPQDDTSETNYNPGEPPEDVSSQAEPEINMEKGTPDEGVKYKCDRCKKTYSSLYWVQNHTRSCFSYHCESCDTVLKNLCQLKKHIKYQHQATFKCDSCVLPRSVGVYYETNEVLNTSLCLKFQ